MELLVVAAKAVAKVVRLSAARAYLPGRPTHLKLRIHSITRSVLNAQECIPMFVSVLMFWQVRTKAISTLQARSAVGE